MNTGEILIYQSKQGDIKIDVRLEDETVWLTQEQMASLFGKARTTITGHIHTVCKDGELSEEMVCRNFRLTIQFFKVVQNKLLWAISQQTAAELVYNRLIASLPLMGMQSVINVSMQTNRIVEGLPELNF